MKGTRQEFINKMMPMISDSYDVFIAALDIKKKEAQEKMRNIDQRMESLKTLQEELENNIGRATDGDLKSYHYLFFGTEGNLIK